MSGFAAKIGFVGSGRMATALARGCVKNQLIEAGQVLAGDPSDAARASFAAQIPGVEVFDSAEAVLEQAEIVFLAVKPQVMPAVLENIAPQVTPSHVLVSIAAGISLARLSESLPLGTRVVRVMPNTPCLVGFGASCYSRGPHATPQDAARVHQILASVGIAFEVEEEFLDAVTGLSGSGPAFVYSVIEALARGGIQMGLPPELALQLAAATTRGAAEMVIATGQSPAELRQQVTSPGGTTLAGLERLDQLEGAEAFAEAVVAATKRSEELGRA